MTRLLQILFLVVVLSACQAAPKPRTPDRVTVDEPSSAGSGEDMPSSSAAGTFYTVWNLPEGNFEVVQKMDEEYPHVLVQMLDGEAKGIRYRCEATFDSGCKPLKRSCVTVRRDSCRRW